MRDTFSKTTLQRRAPETRKPKQKTNPQTPLTTGLDSAQGVSSVDPAKDRSIPPVWGTCLPGSSKDRVSNRSKPPEGADWGTQSLGWLLVTVPRCSMFRCGGRGNNRWSYSSSCDMGGMRGPGLGAVPPTEDQGVSDWPVGGKKSNTK